MKYAKLGNTDIEVSKICIGGMSFGEASKNFHEWTLNQEESTKMIKEAYDLGVNFIDTANCYSFGTSEQYIGKALKELQIPRDKIVIASKVYFNEGKLSKQAIKREIEKTLTNLQTTYLDLYQIHRFDYDTPILEVMEALKKELRPEFINRIDEIIVFHKLNDTEINQIIDIMLKEVINRLAAQKIKVELEPQVKELIASKGIDKNFGARPLRRTIQNLVEDKLAEAILDGVMKKGQKTKVEVKDGKVIVK